MVRNPPNSGSGGRKCLARSVSEGWSESPVFLEIMVAFPPGHTGTRRVIDRIHYPEMKDLPAGIVTAVIAEGVTKITY
jgi:hypothetical protein